MKILWLTNSILPVTAEIIRAERGLTGGWTDALSRDLISSKEAELISVYPSKGAKKNVSGEEAGLKWYGFKAPKTAPLKYDRKRYRYFRKLIKKERPDIVHIWGTEYTYAAEMSDASRGIVPTVVSIQGIISECAARYTERIPSRVLGRKTFHDFIRKDDILRQQQKFSIRGEFEKKALGGVKHVIGRTDWDKAKIKELNPDAVYHHCEETLREEFYNGESWSLDKCEKHSIFMAESYYPIKGMHIAVRILRRLKNRYPDVKLYTTGRDPRCRGIRNRFRQNTYENYISRLIQRYGLDGNLICLGRLGAKEMKERYLLANVYLQASVIENSPNSLSEAIITGTPSVASDVGGTSSVVGEFGPVCLYDIDKPEQAAKMIGRIFDRRKAEDFGVYREMRDYALKKHDIQAVTRQYMDCYKEILQEAGGAGK